MWSTKRITTLALLIAFASIGANIKIPSIVGTPALDAFPAFLGALILGPANGALVAALGHILSSLTVGFPLTLPIHLLIAAGMAGIVALYAVISRYSLWWGLAAGILLNGILFPAIFIPIPGFGKAFFIAMYVPLLVASALNIILAKVVFKFLKPVFTDNYVSNK